MPAAENINHNWVTVGKPTEGGCVYAALYSSDLELPEDATTSMSTFDDFVSLGDLSSDGFTESNSKTKTDHNNWGNETVLSTTSEETNTYNLAFIEVDRASVAKLRYGSQNVTEDTDGSVKSIEGKTGVDEEWALVIDELESSGYLRRTVVERAAIDSFEDIAHNSENLLAYGMTFKALKGKGNIFNIYRAKPATGSTGSTGATGDTGLEEG